MAEYASLAQQVHQSAVKLIDFLAPVGNIHKRSAVSYQPSAISKAAKQQFVIRG